MPRPPIGDQAMSSTERSRRHRARHRATTEPTEVGQPDARQRIAELEAELRDLRERIVWRRVTIGDAKVWICFNWGERGRAYRLHEFLQDDPMGPLAQLDTWIERDRQYRRLGNYR